MQFGNIHLVYCHYTLRVTVSLALSHLISSHLIFVLVNLHFVSMQIFVKTSTLYYSNIVRFGADAFMYNYIHTKNQFKSSYTVQDILSVFT